MKNKIIRSGLFRFLPLFLIDFVIPKKNKIFIYGAFGGEMYGENSRFLFEYAIKKEPQFQHYWVTSNKKLFNELKIKFPKNIIYAKSLKGFFSILRAKNVFVSDHVTDVFYFLTKRHRIINLWHGIPLKKIENCAENNFPLKNKIYRKLFLHKKYNYIISSSNIEKIIISKCFDIPIEKIIVTGMPRNDIIKNYKLEKFSFLNDYKFVILYAPTLRDYEKPNFFPFKNMDYIDLDKFLLKNKIILILRGHKGNLQLGQKKPSRKFIKLNNMDKIKNLIILNHDKLIDINTIFNYIDLVITDYSSLYFDFILTNKPVMFIPYDIKKYEKERGFLFEYGSITPGPKIENYDEFKKEILKSLRNKKYYLEERIFVKNLLFKYKDSYACKRIFDFMRRMIK